MHLCLYACMYVWQVVGVVVVGTYSCICTYGILHMMRQYFGDLCHDDENQKLGTFVCGCGCGCGCGYGCGCVCVCVCGVLDISFCLSPGRKGGGGTEEAKGGAAGERKEGRRERGREGWRERESVRVCDC